MGKRRRGTWRSGLVMLDWVFDDFSSKFASLASSLFTHSYSMLQRNISFFTAGFAKSLLGRNPCSPS